MFEKLQALLVGQAAADGGGRAGGRRRAADDHRQGSRADAGAAAHEAAHLVVEAADHRPVGGARARAVARRLARRAAAGRHAPAGRPAQGRPLPRRVPLPGAQLRARRASRRSPTSDHEKREELLLAAVEELVRRGEQVLAFVPDRATTVLFARVLAQRLTPGAGDGRRSRSCASRRRRSPAKRCSRCSAAAIAFHNSDLSPEEREIVERHFRGGAIRALFSTSTLAVGMNLPVKNVVLDHQRWEYLRRYGRWSLEDISRSEYENMSGRAGRLSLVERLRSIDPGHLLAVRGGRLASALRRRRSSRRSARRSADAPLENHVLDLMASGLASSRAELEEMLLSSFTGWAHWAQKMSRDEFSEALAKAVAIGLGGGLLRALGERPTGGHGRRSRRAPPRESASRPAPCWRTGRRRPTAPTVDDLEVLLTVSAQPGWRRRLRGPATRRAMAGRLSGSAARPRGGRRRGGAPGLRRRGREPAEPRVRRHQGDQEDAADGRLDRRGSGRRIWRAATTSGQALSAESARSTAGSSTRLRASPAPAAGQTVAAGRWTSWPAGSRTGSSRTPCRWRD